LKKEQISICPFFVNNVSLIPHSALSTGTSGINDEATELLEALARELSQQTASILNYAPMVHVN
jgi:hypothetical protein